jgi:hypothetical protein
LRPFAVVRADRQSTDQRRKAGASHAYPGRFIARLRRDLTASTDQAEGRRETADVVADSADEVCDMKLDRKVSLRAACDRMLSSRPTPQSTIEAVLYCVRERGLAALKEPTNLERLSQCDGEARAQINQRIAKLEKGSRR